MTMYVILLVTIILLGALNVAGLLYPKCVSVALVAGVSVILVVFAIGCIVEVLA
jgi:hypothetical protein